MDDIQRHHFKKLFKELIRSGTSIKEENKWVKFYTLVKKTSKAKS